MPAIGLGTWRTFDTEEDREPLVQAAVDAGIDLFDSSPMYGRAEEALGKALARGLRSEVLVASKIWTPDAAEGRRQAERAVGWFGGRVDIYQVHNLVAWREQLAMLEAMKAEGRVGAVGATDYREASFEDLADVMRTGRLDMIQIPYNPIRREAESALLPLAAELGLGVLTMSPLQGGILERQPTREQLAELGVETWPQAVLKWIASDPRVSCVLTATSRPERATEASLAGDQPFFDSAQRELVVRIANP